MRLAPYVVPIPHIYPSVGYCIVYFRLGPSTTFNKIGEIGSTLSFCGNVIRSRMAANLFQKGMKKLFFLLAAVVWMGSCGDDYDDSALRGRVDGLEDRIEQLEELCQRMNTNISSLQTLVEALQQNDYVTGVVPVMQGGETVGYTISFTKSEPVTIYHGEKGEQGDTGATPVMGVEEVDGIYYWTVDGKPLTDGDGNRIPASAHDGAPGATPQFKIEGGYWHVSYNDGESWQQLGQATGDKGDPGIPGGDSIFASVEETDDAVIFTLADGETTITIPRRQTLSVTFTEGNVLQFDVDETKTVHYTITGGTSENVVKAELQNLDGGYTLRTTPTDATRGTIEIAAAIPTVNRVIVSVSDGTQTIMTAISVSGKEGFDGSTITVATPGTLDDLLADYDKTTITELTVVGNLNDGDISTLKGLPNLSVLDMEQVNLEIMPQNAFSLKSSLTSIKLPKTLKTIQSYAFYECRNLTGELVIPEGVITIMKDAFNKCVGFTGNLVIPGSVTSIGENAFSECVGFTGDLVLPDDITSIGINAFWGCSGFTGNLVLPKNITTIGVGVFCGCRGLTGELLIPEGVTTIGEIAFGGCENFTGDLILPESVTTIGNSAFGSCSGLTDIYCKSTIPPQLGDSVFPFSSNRTLYIPVGCAEAYRTAPIWSDFSFKEIVETDFSDLKNIE